MERKNEEEKTEDPWVGHRFLGVAAAGAAVAIAAGFFMMSQLRDGPEEDQRADDPPARPGRTMKGPGTGGERINRDNFEAAPADFFRKSRRNGTKSAVDAFK
nr:unnamed protein product [Digitaria exilis]